MAATEEQILAEEAGEDEFEAGAIDDRADAGEDLEEEEDGQFAIPGTREGMSTTAGGRRPGFSEAKLAAIPLRITGEFRKEERVRLVIDAIVQDVRLPDEYKGGEIVRTRRVHIFKPLAVEVVETDQP